MDKQELIDRLKEHCEYCELHKLIHYDYLLSPYAAKQIIKALEHKCSLPPSIEEALNSGDGIYRP